MSYQATDWVFHLNLGHRLGTPGKKYPAVKQVLNALAHKCDSRTGICQPISVDDIANSQEIGESTARRGLKIVEEAGIIRYLTKGNGRGIKSVIDLVDFRTKVLGAAEKVLTPSTKVLTPSEKALPASAPIRKKEKQEYEVNTHHSSAAMNVAIKTWISVKERLKATISVDEWNSWLRPMFLLKVMDQGLFLLFSLPPNDRMIRAAQANKDLLLRALTPHGFAAGSFVKYPDDYEVDRLCKEFPEFYEQLPDALRKRRPERALA